MTRKISIDVTFAKVAGTAALASTATTAIGSGGSPAMGLRQRHRPERAGHRTRISQVSPLGFGNCLISSRRRS